MPVYAFATPFPRQSRGITLVELLAVLALTGILAALAIPAYQDSIARGHVKNAAETIFGLVQQAKIETQIRDTDLSIVVDEDQWCVGLSDNPDCDCSVTSGPEACYLEVAGHPVLHRVTGSEFPEVAVTETIPGVKTTFSRIRRSAGPWGSIYVASRDQVLAIKFSLARSRLCAPPDSPIIGYQPC